MNPHYGTLGMLAIPYFVFFEVLGPLVEVAGIAILIIALAFHFVNLSFAGLFFMVAITYGIFLSVLSLLIEEASYHRYDRWQYLLQAVESSILENFGFRQMHAYWRLEDVIQAIRKSDRTWGAMSRKGFTQPKDD